MIAEVRTRVEHELPSWCKQRLGALAAITRNTDLLAEGYLDSMLVLDLVSYVENQFGVAVDSTDISPENFSSIQALARLALLRQAA